MTKAKKILSNVWAWIRANPARSVSYATTVIVLVAGQLHIVLNADTVGDDLALALLILGGGELTHSQVTPK